MTEQERKQAKKEAVKAFENSDYLIVIPKSHLAMCVYGYGATWCCTSSDENQFYGYSPLEFPMFILITKNESEYINGQWYQAKYLIQFEHDGLVNFQNQPIMTNSFFSKHPILAEALIYFVKYDKFRKYSKHEKEWIIRMLRKSKIGAL